MISVTKTLVLELDPGQVEIGKYGLSITTQEEENGHYVVNLKNESYAEIAGLREKDKIIAVNDENSKQISHEELVEMFKSQKDKFSFKVERIVESTSGSDPAQEIKETTNNKDPPVANEEAAEEIKETTNNKESPVANEEAVEEIIETTNNKESPVANEEAAEEIKETTNNKESPVANEEEAEEIIEITNNKELPVANEEAAEKIMETTNNKESPVANEGNNEKPQIEKPQIINDKLENKNSNMNYPEPTNFDLKPPRLCRVVISDGLKFGVTISKRNLQSDFIVSDIIKKSPSYRAGLRVGDVVIEIDNQRIADMSYEEFLDLIKNRSTEISILVIDKASYEYHYESRVSEITSSQAEFTTNLQESECGSTENWSDSVITDDIIKYKKIYFSKEKKIDKIPRGNFEMIEYLSTL